MDFKEILTTLEGELSGKKTMFGKKIDTEECLKLVLQLKSEYPKAVQSAESIISRQNSIIEEAKAEARKMVDEASKTAERLVSVAQEQAQSMIDNTNVVRNAQERAQGIIEAAGAESDKLAMQSYNAMLTLFTNAENSLIKVFKQLQDSRDLLMGAFTEDSK